jgi:hypothetical protein
MTSSSAAGPTATTSLGRDEAGYEAPTLTVLGTVAELTQQGSGATDELLNDGSQI